MIRDRFYCPNCQLEERPVLIVTPWYNCPDCNTISKRADLLSKRTAKLVLAGALVYPTISPVSLGTGTLFDATQLTTSLVSSPFATKAGDRLVVCVASFLNGAAPSSVTFTGGNATLAIAVNDGTLFSSIWYTNFADISTNTAVDNAVVTWAATAPISAAITVTRLDGSAKTSVLDKTKSSITTTTLITTGNFANSTLKGDTAISAIAVLEQLSDTPLRHEQPFVFAARTATTDGGGSDCSINEGRWTNATGIYSARATQSLSIQAAIAAASFKAAP
mgnify:FL=1